VLAPPGDAATGFQITEARRQHENAVSLFLETNMVQQTIVQQINEAVDDSVMMPLIDKETGIVNATVQVVMEYLFKIYGNISDQKLNEARQATVQHTYVHADPLANVFNVIHRYSLMAEAQGTPETPKQLVSIGKIILTKANIFADYVEKWNWKPDADQTWPAFKTNFTEAQANYKRARPTDTVESMGYTSNQSANAMIENVLEQLAEREAEAEARAEMIQEEAAQQNEIVNQANAATTQDNALLDRINALSTTITNLNNRVNDQGSYGGRYRAGGRGGGRGGGRQNQQQQQVRNNTNNRTSSARKYCWTHGACAHTGVECTAKAEGHKEEATFSNLLNGSKKYCYWLA